MFFYVGESASGIPSSFNELVDNIDGQLSVVDDAPALISAFTAIAASVINEVKGFPKFKDTSSGEFLRLAYGIPSGEYTLVQRLDSNNEKKFIVNCHDIIVQDACDEELVQFAPNPSDANAATSNVTNSATYWGACPKGCDSCVVQNNIATCLQCYLPSFYQVIIRS